MNRSNNQVPVRPEWSDARDVRARFGLCKSTLYRLAEEGKVRTASLREPGMTRGKRLFSTESIVAHIEAMADRSGANLPAEGGGAGSPEIAGSAATPSGGL